MKNQKNLKTLSSEISNQLIDVIYLLDTLEELTDNSGKEEVVIRTAKNKIKKSFYINEMCRKIISPVE